jgi:hypothetical protein
VPVTVFHAHSATTPDITNASYDILPQRDWNAMHAATLALSGTELIGAFGAGGNVTFGTNVFGAITGNAPAVQPGGAIIAGTGTATGTVSLANGGGVSFGAIGNTVTAQVAPVVPSGAIIAGTATATGTVSFANANGVSFGAIGNTVTAQAVATATAGVGGIVAGTQTVTVGQMMFVNGNGISFGLNNSNLTASYTVPTVPAQSVQTQGLLQAASMAGNSAGAAALIGSGTLVIAGGNNVTVSQAGNAISINAVGAGAGAVAGVAVSNVTFNTGTVMFANGNGITFGSQTGNAITASIANPIGTSTGFAGTNVSGSVTLNTAGLVLAMSAPAQTGTFAGTSSGFTGANISGSITHNTAGLALSLSATGPGAGTSTGFAGTNVSGSMALNTAGLALSLAAAPQTGTFAGTTTGFTGANISGSMTHNTAGLALSLSAPAPAAGVLTASGYHIGNTTLSSSGTRALSSMVVSAAGLISAGMSGQTLVISAPATVSLTQFSGGLSALGNTAGVTGLASQQFVLAGGPNVTLSGSTSGGSATVSILAAAGGTATGGGGVAVSASGNASGVSLISSGTLVLVGTNGISLSQAGNSLSLSGPVFSNSNGVTFGTSNNQITASVAVRPVVQISGNTTGTAAVISTGTLSLAAGANITLSQVGNAVSIIGATAGAGTGGGIGAVSASGAAATAGTVSFSNLLGGVAFGMSGNTITGQCGPNAISFASAAGGSIAGPPPVAGNIYSGTMTLFAGSNVTFSQGGQGVTLLAGGGATGTATGVASATGFVVGNTTSSSAGTLPLSSLVVSAGGLVSAGFSSNTLVISGPATQIATLFSGGMSTGGNTAGTIGMASQQLVLAGGSNVTLSGSTNAGSMTVSIAAGGVAPVGRFVWPPSAYDWVPGPPPSTNNVSVQWFPCDHALTASRLDLLMQIGPNASAPNVNTSALALSAYAGIYSRAGGTATILSSVASGSVVTTYSGASSNSGQLTAWQSGPVIRPCSVPLNVSLSAGEYWLGCMINTSQLSMGTATTSLMSISGAATVPGLNWGMLVQINPSFSPAVYVDNLTGATNSTSANISAPVGLYLLTASLPPTIAFTAVNQTNSDAVRVCFVLRNY